jgi:hypothetical protein
LLTKTPALLLHVNRPVIVKDLQFHFHKCRNGQLSNIEQRRSDGGRILE